MQRYTDEVLSEETGLAVLGASITVFVAGTQTRATLFSANDIASAHLPNPIVAAAGKFAFYAADGLYDLLVRNGARSKLVPGVEIYDLGQMAALAALNSANLPTVNLFQGASTKTVPPAITAVRTTGFSAVGTGGADYAADGMVDAAYVAKLPRTSFLTANGRGFRMVGRTITATQAGVVPGEADSGGALTNLFADAAALGGRAVLSAGDAYTVAPRPPVIVDGQLYAYACALIPPHVDVHSEGAIVSGVGANLLGALGTELGRTTFAYQAFGPGSVDFPVGNDLPLYTSGMWVLRRFGDVPYDTPETTNFGFARVVGPTPNVAGYVRLDVPMTRAWTQNAGGDVRNHHISRLDLSVGRAYSGVYRVQNSAGLVISYEISPQIDTIIGDNPGAGALICQYVENFHARHVEIVRQNQTDGNAFGMRFAEANGRIDSIVARDCARNLIFAEDGCDISIGYLKDVNTSLVARTVIGAITNCNVHVERFVATGRGGQDLAVAYQNSRVTAGSVLVDLASDPTQCFAPAVSADRVELRIGSNPTELYLGHQAEWFETAVPIAANGAAQYYFPAGFVAQMYAVLEGGVVPADVTYAGWGRTAAAGSIANIQAQEQFTASLAVGGETRIAGSVGMFGKNQGADANWTYRTSPVFLNVAFAAGAVAAWNKLLRVRMLIVRNALA